jgi:hypothetical protein
MLEEAKGAVIVAPIVVAMTMIAPENAVRGSSDLLGRLESPLVTRCCNFSSLMRTRSIALPRWARSKGLAFLGMDNEDSHARFV